MHCLCMMVFLSFLQSSIENAFTSFDDEALLKLTVLPRTANLGRENLVLQIQESSFEKGQFLCHSERVCFEASDIQVGHSVGVGYWTWRSTSETLVTLSQKKHRKGRKKWRHLKVQAVEVCTLNCPLQRAHHVLFCT